MADIKEERIFCAEQINVPPSLPVIMKEFTKECIRRNPSEGEADIEKAKLKIYEWSEKYFREKAARTNAK